MKNPILFCILTVCAIAGLMGAPGRAAEPGAVETWDAGGAEGWVLHDPLNSSSAPATAFTGALEVVFGPQSMPVPEVKIVRADISASRGAFVNNYWRTAITHVSFDVWCASLPPGNLRLYLANDVSENWWYLPLATPATTGQWVHYELSTSFTNGWRTGLGGDAAQFKADLAEITWAGLQIQRNSSTNQQLVRLDNFTVHGASMSLDADADGMSDWAEFIAGTAGDQAASHLQAELGIAGSGNGMVLRWASSANRVYGIPRATNLVSGFLKIVSGLPATPPTNTYVDHSATNASPYYYRIVVED